MEQADIVDDAVCELCGQEVESTPHAIRDCTLPQQIWASLIPVPSQTAAWHSTDPTIWMHCNCVRTVALVGIGDIFSGM